MVSFARLTLPAGTVERSNPSSTELVPFTVIGDALPKFELGEPDLISVSPDTLRTSALTAPGENASRAPKDIATVAMLRIRLIIFYPSSWIVPTNARAVH